MPGATSPRRRRRDRSETDQLVFNAVRAMLLRDGALHGFTLQDVADEAGVNRVQLYQNFGSKQALLRAAINTLLEAMGKERNLHRELPFAERRRRIFEQFLSNPDVVRLEALLAQDGDEGFRVFPELELALAAYGRDVADGGLPPDADAVALHVLTAATYMGYCIFRDVFVRDTAVPAETLDQRVLDAFTALLDAYAGSTSG